MYIRACVRACVCACVRAYEGIEMHTDTSCILEKEYLQHQRARVSNTQKRTDKDRKGGEGGET